MEFRETAKGIPGTTFSLIILQLCLSTAGNAQNDHGQSNAVILSAQGKCACYENSVTFIAAGRQFVRKDGKIFSVSVSSWVKNRIQLDELQTITEKTSPQVRSPKL
jgi:hypothetical protein